MPEQRELRIKVRNADLSEAAHLIDRLRDPGLGIKSAQGVNLRACPAHKSLYASEVSQCVLLKELVDQIS